MQQPEVITLDPLPPVPEDQDSAILVSGRLSGGAAATGQTIIINVSQSSAIIVSKTTQADNQGRFFVSLDLSAYGEGSYILSATAVANSTYLSSTTAEPLLITCYCSGTLICTVEGDVAVEQLRAGDVVVTASGERRGIRWLGHRTVDCRNHPRPQDAQPIRVSAHAFGPERPRRDLWLSPGHLVLVGADGSDETGAGGHLVPIMCLINGTTIERMPVDEVTYWHVELDTHDILLAEGLPAESYLDWGDRAFFAEGADHALANPDFVVPGLAGRCRPVVIDGPAVEAERRRLDMVFALRLASAAAWPDAQEAAFLAGAAHAEGQTQAFSTLVSLLPSAGLACGGSLSRQRQRMDIRPKDHSG